MTHGVCVYHSHSTPASVHVSQGLESLHLDFEARHCLQAWESMVSVHHHHIGRIIRYLLVLPAGPFLLKARKTKRPALMTNFWISETV